jgi:hypothetical protein
MKAEKLRFQSVAEAARAIDGLGSSNSKLMATRAIHLNVALKDVPAPGARSLKRAYNEVGGEAAISHDAYVGSNDGVTDMILMGTVYQHREVRRVLGEQPELIDLIETILIAVENSPEAQND